MTDELKKHLNDLLDEPLDETTESEPSLNIIGAELARISPNLPLPLRTAGYWDLNGDGHLVYKMPDLGVNIRHNDRDLWVVMADQPKGAKQWVDWSFPVNLGDGDGVMRAVARAAAHYEKQVALQPYSKLGLVAFDGWSDISAVLAAREAIQKLNEYTEQAAKLRIVLESVATHYQTVMGETTIEHHVLITAMMEDM